MGWEAGDGEGEKNEGVEGGPGGERRGGEGEG